MVGGTLLSWVSASWEDKAGSWVSIKTKWICYLSDSLMEDEGGAFICWLISIFCLSQGVKSSYHFLAVLPSFCGTTGKADPVPLGSAQHLVWVLKGAKATAALTVQTSTVVGWWSPTLNLDTLGQPLTGWGSALAGRAVVGRALHSTSNYGPAIWGQVSPGRLANWAQRAHNSLRAWFECLFPT